MYTILGAQSQRLPPAAAARLHTYARMLKTFSVLLVVRSHRVTASADIPLQGMANREVILEERFEAVSAPSPHAGFVAPARLHVEVAQSL
jgi:hypothetical protein